MQENIIDVLVYIFKNYMDVEIDESKDQVLLEEDLTDAGFHQIEIQKAFEWLDDLALQQSESIDLSKNTKQSFRIYAEREQQYIDFEAQCFLFELEQAGILIPSNRELVIERAMAINLSPLSLEDLKWIILLVLSNQPTQATEFAIMYDLVYNGTEKSLH